MHNSDIKTINSDTNIVRILMLLSWFLVVVTGFSPARNKLQFRKVDKECQKEKGRRQGTGDRSW
jgi:hypothetical protein